MKILNASFTTVILRYYLMMSIVIIAFFIGAPLLAFLAFPVFLMAILGVSVDYSAFSNAFSMVKRFFNPTVRKEPQLA